MTREKRMFDLCIAGVLAVITAPMLVVLLLYVLVREGRPVFHVSTRMKGPDQPFSMWKIRTMTVTEQNCGVTGGYISSRITASGRWLRRLRLDELPQLWHVLRGDMSLVGPRPPLQIHVARHPLRYAKILHARPGLTGLGTLRFLQYEHHILASCRSARETDRVYERYCLPRKVRAELIYLRRQSLMLDLFIIWRTGIAFLGGFRGESPCRARPKAPFVAHGKNTSFFWSWL